MHRHAKEYLIEFANQSSTKDWLRLLIDKTIQCNGVISNEDFEVVYSLLKADSTSTINTISSASSQSTEKPLSLVSLKHKNGVCALQDNTTIKFSSAITILYGLNGSGKSSYFKILNEIIGGNIRKEIVGNIYSNTNAPINVELNYILDSVLQTHECHDEITRASNSLNSIRVFDTSYLNGLLEVRPTDETVVIPYGLKLFTILSNEIDSIKQRITNEIDSFRLPIIDLEYLTPALKEAISNNRVSKEQRHSIESQYVYRSDIDEKIDVINSRIKEISETDYGSRLVVLSRIETLLTTLLHKVKVVCEKYVSEIAIVKDLVFSCQLLQEESESVKAKTSILGSIGDTNSKEWRDFILSGENFVQSTKFSKDICPYCRQPIIDTNVKELLKAYSIFLNDKTEKDLQDVNKRIDGKISEFEHIQINLVDALNSDLNDEDISILKQNITKLEQFLKSQYHVMAQMLRSKKLLQNLCDIVVYIPKIDYLIERYKTEKASIVELNSNKSKRIEELKQQLLPLLQHKYISSNKSLFESWFKENEAVERLKKLSKISTRSITELSETAYNELITNQLVSEFNNQLKAIGLKRHTVELNTANKKKGIVNMVIKVNGHSIHKVLSEGELKGIGLALFVAECKLQQVPYPIVFDDPVNSLDHQIAANFANILMSIPHQIVVFTHNRLFLDAFECSKEHHICKQMDNGCNSNKGKHIYLYHVQDEGQSHKGVIVSHKKDCANTYILSAQSKLNKTPFEESRSVASDLRNAIERIIDEIILNRQIPTRYSNKNSRIDWDGLSKLLPDSSIIGKLNEIHSRLSGGDLHNGVESLENPITKEEFVDMVNVMNHIIAHKALPVS